MGDRDNWREEFRLLSQDLRTHLENLQSFGLDGLSLELHPGQSPEVGMAGRATVSDSLSNSPALSQDEAGMVGLLFEDALFKSPAPSPPVFQHNKPMDKSLEEIRADIGDCKRCKLCEGRTNIVFGEGSPGAELVFVGEAPGADEDEQGRPFVGRAGQLLTRMIEAMGMKREDVYICNVIKCRPPNNDFAYALRVGAIAACQGFVHRQILVIRPKVIVALGNPAVQALLRTKQGITQLRGKWQSYQDIPTMPTYHPAFLLRSPDKKRETWEDLKRVRDFLGKGSN